MSFLFNISTFYIEVEYNIGALFKEYTIKDKYIV